MSQEQNGSDLKDSSSELICMYDKLRTEILHNDDTGLQLFGFTIALISAAMGLAFNLPTFSLLKIGVFSGAICLSFLSMHQTIERVGGTFLIASYIRHFLEDKSNHLKWETHIQEYRKDYRAKSGRIFATLIFTYILVAFANLLLVTFYTLITWDIQKKHEIKLAFENWTGLVHGNSIAESLFVFSLIAWVSLTIYGPMRYHQYVGKNERTFGTIWKAVKEGKTLARREKIHKRNIVPSSTPKQESLKPRKDPNGLNDELG